MEAISNERKDGVFNENDGWFTTLRVPEKSQGKWGFVKITPALAKRYFPDGIDHYGTIDGSKELQKTLDHGGSFDIFIHVSSVDFLDTFKKKEDKKLISGQRIVPKGFSQSEKSKSKNISLYGSLWYQDTVNPLNDEEKDSVLKLIASDDPILKKFRVPNETQIKVKVRSDAVALLRYVKPDIEMVKISGKSGLYQDTISPQIGDVDFVNGLLYGLPIDLDNQGWHLKSFYSKYDHKSILDGLFKITSPDYSKIEAYNQLNNLAESSNAFDLKKLTDYQINLCVSFLKENGIRCELAEKVYVGGWSEGGSDFDRGPAEGDNYYDTKLTFPEGVLSEKLLTLKKKIVDRNDEYECWKKVVGVKSAIEI